MKNRIEHPKVFISYAWGTQEHDEKVIALATNAPIIKLLLYLVIIGITLPLSYGVTSTFIDLSRDKTICK